MVDRKTEGKNLYFGNKLENTSEKLTIFAMQKETPFLCPKNARPRNKNIGQLNVYSLHPETSNNI